MLLEALFLESQCHFLPEFDVELRRGLPRLRDSSWKAERELKGLTADEDEPHDQVQHTFMSQSRSASAFAASQVVRRTKTEDAKHEHAHLQPELQPEGCHIQHISDHTDLHWEAAVGEHEEADRSRKARPQLQIGETCLAIAQMRVRLWQTADRSCVKNSPCTAEFIELHTALPASQFGHMSST